MGAKSQKNGSDYEKNHSVMNECIASGKYDVVPSGEGEYYVFEKGSDIYCATILIGWGFYRYLKEHSIKDDWKEITSKTMIPDCVVIVGNVWHIVEFKSQEKGRTSQDDMLLYCGHRKSEFAKIIRNGAGFMRDRVEFHYNLSETFNDPRMASHFEYIKDKLKCDYYFEEIPLDVFGL